MGAIRARRTGKGKGRNRRPFQRAFTARGSEAIAAATAPLLRDGRALAVPLDRAGVGDRREDQDRAGDLGVGFLRRGCTEGNLDRTSSGARRTYVNLADVVAVNRSGSSKAS